MPPDIYNLENNAHILSILIKNKFFISRIETNQYIDLREYSYENSISRGNKKRIQKCIRNYFKFIRLDESNYYDAYKVIQENRRRKKYSISMSWDSLLEMIGILPEKFHVFGVFDKDKLIASAICINVFKDILYVFYWGEISNYETYSPIAFLSNNLMDYAKERKFKFVDIGTSSIHSVPNYGLVTFKENVGCFCCNKIYLEKEIKK
tara:strand:- start:208 stop:828 length:621 start_codon:yes stop_codon:yes gene_type:complete